MAKVVVMRGVPTSAIVLSTRPVLIRPAPLNQSPRPGTIDGCKVRLVAIVRRHACNDYNSGGNLEPTNVQRTHLFVQCIHALLACGRVGIH